VARYLYWIIPSLFCLALYWHGLKAWFQMDDFAWLSLHTRVHDFRTFLDAVFTPMAQGTVRPLSERLFFLSFWHMFGMEALPYRAVAFGTQFVNLILMTVVTRRLTGSAAAGLIAPLLWLASPILYEPMVWTSAYNQILCAFFLLLDMYLLLRYVDTGEKRYFIGLWISFLLGFGALELNVVFPAIAVTYLFLFARRYLFHIAPMFLVSIAYTVWHRRAGQSLQNVVYAMDWSPLSLLRVLGEYIRMSVSATEMPGLSNLTELQLNNAAFVVLAAVTIFVAVMLRKRNWLVLFFLAWYAITLAPYLPLANHVSDYYLTVPTIGLAMLSGWAIVVAWQANTAARITAAVAIALFAAPCAWQAWTLTRKWSQESRRVRHMVRGLASIHKRYPDKTIILKGVDNDLFWGGVYDQPQLALGWRRVYLTADTQKTVVAFPEKGSIGERFMPDAVALEAIRSKEAVVYDASRFPLRNVTSLYERMLTFDSQILYPHIIDAGVPSFAKFRREGWFDPTQGSCWTGKLASVEMRGPAGPNGKLTFQAYLTPQHTAAGPFTVEVRVDGRHVGTQKINVGDTALNPTYDLPAEFTGKRSMLVTVEVSRTLVAPPDQRELGLLFGTFEVTP
jgi:hypothetical protein